MAEDKAAGVRKLQPSFRMDTVQKEHIDQWQEVRSCLTPAVFSQQTVSYPRRLLPTARSDCVCPHAAAGAPTRAATRFLALHACHI
jgi:hypothetical protein